MSPTTKKALSSVVAILVTLAFLALRDGWLTGGKPAGSDAGGRAGSSADAPSRAPAPSPDRPAARAGYDPASAEPKDAIPGGGLAAHEGVEGGHTLDRHVGRSVEDLRRRLEREDKREVSTFADEASANRFVAQALYARRADVARWLASNPSGNAPFPYRLGVPAGDVLRRGARDVVPGRSVQVVLAPSRRFPEGFRIVTAYVTLP
jgi:hypothetical protein